MRVLAALVLGLLLVVPAWAIDVSPPPVTLPLAGSDGGTGLTTAAIGDLLYASATTPTWARLAAVAVNQVLVSGGVGAAPAWSGTPTLGGLTLGGTLAMAGNAITFTDATLLRETTNRLTMRNGGTEASPAPQELTLHRFYVSDTDYSRVLLGWQEGAGVFKLQIDVAGTSTARDILVQGWRFGGGYSVGINKLAPNNDDETFGSSSRRVDATFSRIVLSAPADRAPFALTGYSLTGSSAISMVAQSGTLNTSGVVDVWKLAVINTSAGAGSYLMALYAGAAGTTLEYAVSLTGTTTQAGSATVGCTTAPSTTAGGVLLCATAFASLPADTDGTLRYCSDCDPPTLVDATCTSAGTKTGSLAFRANGLWKCLS